MTANTETPTRFAVHANGTFWGIFDGADPDEAIQAAAEECGTDGNTHGLTAATLAETLRRIDRDYRDNDMTLAEGVEQWALARGAVLEPEYLASVATCQPSAWASEDDLADFIAWVDEYA